MSDDEGEQIEQIEDQVEDKSARAEIEERIVEMQKMVSQCVVILISCFFSPRLLTILRLFKKTLGHVQGTPSGSNGACFKQSSLWNP
jgi:hypothetical protein